MISFFTLPLNAQEKKEESRENINTWLNSPMLQEMASRPELQALISLYAKQIFVVNGRVFASDEYEPKPYPLPGAHIEVKCLGDTTETHVGVSNEKGEFLVPIFLRQRLKSNLLHIKVSYIGMDGIDRNFTPKEVKLLGQKVQQVELDSIVLHSNPVTLAEAEVIGELMKMYQNGDTVIFNADAYEMPSGSVLLDLVRRLPGLQYIGGQLTYMNRSIEEIRLNGDNFFKHDMSIALQNMPHDKLKSLKVYEVPDDTLDVMSDKHLVMDMKTKDPTERVLFANAGVGTTAQFDHFDLYADVSRWKKNGAQIHAQFNTSDIPSVGAIIDKSVNTTANASYEQQLGKTKVYGKFYHDYNRTEMRRSDYNRTFMPDYTQDSRSESSSGSKSKSYSGDIRLDGQIGENRRWNTSANVSKSEDENWNASTDSISTDTSTVSSTRSNNRTTSDNKNFNWDGKFIQYFGEDRNTEIGIDASASFRDGKSISTNLSDTRFYLLGDSLRTTNRIIETPSKDTQTSANIHFQHRFGDFTTLRVSYDFHYSYNTNSQAYNDMQGSNLLPIDSMHYDNKFKEVSHGPSVSFEYDNQLFLLQLRGKARPTFLSSDNIQYTHSDHNSYNATNYQANARMEVNMHGKQNKLVLSYSGANNLPSPTSISSEINYSDPMNIRVGNPKLKASFNHQAVAKYTIGSLLSLSSSFEWIDNQKTTLSIIDRNTGARTSMDTNIDGNWSNNSYIFLTKAIGDVTMAAEATYRYNHGVSFIQDFGSNEAKKSVTNWHRLESSVYSTYGNKNLTLIATADYSYDYNKSDYLTTATKGQQVGGSLDVEYTLPIKLNVKLTSDFHYTRKFGYELESANRSEYIWNAKLEYRFLDIFRASLEWRDILDSQRSFNSSMSATGWNESQQYGKTSMIVFKLAVKLNRL